MPRIQLPEGCRGLDMSDGTKYSARPGEKVTVSDEHARAIRKNYGSQGIMHGGERFAVGTKRGRWCHPCRRLWQAWSQTCPRCGEPTVADDVEAPVASRAEASA